MCVVFSVACLLLEGCAAWQTAQPVTPLSYQSSRERIPRTVGKLRRLVALPVEQEAPKACGHKGGISLAYDAAYFKAAAKYLSARKGYEISPLEAGAYADWLVAPQDVAFLFELTTWSGGTRGDTMPGPLARALVERIRLREGADGLLVFHIHMNCTIGNPAARAFFGIATLGLSEVLPNPQLQEIETTYRVAILEVASGRPVWRNEISTGSVALQAHFSFGDARTTEDYLFRDIEPAVPKVLTR